MVRRKFNLGREEVENPWRDFSLREADVNSSSVNHEAIRALFSKSGK